MNDVPDGYRPAGFAIGFLDVAGPYYLKPEGKRTLVGLRVGEHHINYVKLAHGGVLTTLADVALSYQVHASETPKLMPVTNALTINFLAGAKLGDWLVADAQIDRMGKRIAYTSGQIRCGETVLMTMSAVFTILRPKPET